MADFDEQPLPELQLPLAPMLGYDMVGFKRLMMPWTCTMLFEEHEAEEISSLPGTMNCLAVSNKHNCIMVMDVHGLHVHPLSQMRENFLTMPDQYGLEAKVRIDTPAKPYCVRISCDDTKMAIALFNGAVAIYELAACLDGTNKKPLDKTSVPADPGGIPVKDILMNPGDQPSYLALLYGTLRNENTGLRIWDMSTGLMVAQWSHPSGFTSMSWSTRGKQIVTGCGDGKLRQWTQKGELKAEIPGPACTSALSVQSVCWLNNTDFMTAYSRSGSLDTSHVATVLVRHDAKSRQTGYLRFGDTQLNPPIASVTRAPSRMFLALGSWSPFGNMVLHWTSNSATLVPLAQISQDALDTNIPSNKLQLPAIEYAILDPEPPFEAAMPDPELTGDSSEPSLLGVAVDVMATGTIPGTDLPAGPILWTLTTKGNYVAHWLINRSNAPYPGMGGSRPPAAAVSAVPSAVIPSAQPSFGSFGKPTGSTFGGTASAQSAPSWAANVVPEALGNRSIPKPSGFQAGAFSAIAGGTRSFSQLASTPQATSAFDQGTGSKDFDMSGLESDAAVLGTAQSSSTIGWGNIGRPGASVSTSTGFVTPSPSWSQPTQSNLGFGQQAPVTSTPTNPVPLGQRPHPSASFGQANNAPTFAQLATQTPAKSSAGFGMPTTPVAAFPQLTSAGSTSSFGASPTPQLLTGKPLTTPTSQSKPPVAQSATSAPLATSIPASVGPANTFGTPSEVVISSTPSGQTAQSSSNPPTSRPPITKAEADAFFKNLPKLPTPATSATVPSAPGNTMSIAPSSALSASSAGQPPGASAITTGGPSLAESRELFKKLLAGTKATPTPAAKPSIDAIQSTTAVEPKKSNVFEVGTEKVAESEVKGTTSRPSELVDQFRDRLSSQAPPSSLPPVGAAPRSRETDRKEASTSATIEETRPPSAKLKEKETRKEDSKQGNAALPNVLGLSLGPSTPTTAAKVGEQRSQRPTETSAESTLLAIQSRRPSETKVTDLTPRDKTVSPINAPLYPQSSVPVDSVARSESEAGQSSGRVPSDQKTYAAIQVGAAEGSNAGSSSLGGFFTLKKKSLGQNSPVPPSGGTNEQSVPSTTVVPTGGWPEALVPAFHVANGPSAPSQSKGIAAEALRLRSMMAEELGQIQETVAQSRAYHLEVAFSSLVVRGVEDLGNARLWNLGDLNTLFNVMHDLRTGTTDVRDSGMTYKRLIIELEALILKAETKKEECNWFIQARDDKNIEAVRKTKRLGPAQSENQSRLRKSSQLLQQRIEQLEDCVTTLRRRVKQRKTGTTPLTAPALDTMNRIIRNLDLAASTELALLEKQKARLDEAAAGAVPGASGTATRSVKGKVPSQLASVLPHGHRKQIQIMDSRQTAKRLKAVLSDKFTQPLLNTTVINATPMDDKAAVQSDLNFAISRGPLSSVAREVKRTHQSTEPSSILVQSETKPMPFSGPRPAAWDALLAAPYVPPPVEQPSRRARARRNDKEGHAPSGESRHGPIIAGDRAAVESYRPTPLPVTAQSLASLEPTPSTLSGMGSLLPSAPGRTLAIPLRLGQSPPVPVLPRKDWLAAVPPIVKATSAPAQASIASAKPPRATDVPEFYPVGGKTLSDQIQLSEEQINQAKESWGSLGTASGSKVDVPAPRKAGVFQPWTPVQHVHTPSAPLPTLPSYLIPDRAPSGSTAKTATKTHDAPPDVAGKASEAFDVQSFGRPMRDGTSPVLDLQALRINSPEVPSSSKEVPNTRASPRVDTTEVVAKGASATTSQVAEHEASTDRRAHPAEQELEPPIASAPKVSAAPGLGAVSTRTPSHNQPGSNSGQEVKSSSPPMEAHPSINNADVVPSQAPSQTSFVAWLEAAKSKSLISTPPPTSESGSSNPQLSAEAAAFAQKFADWKVTQDKQKALTQPSPSHTANAPISAPAAIFSQPVRPTFKPGEFGPPIAEPTKSLAATPSFGTPYKSAFGPGGSGPALSTSTPTFKSAFGPGGSGLPVDQSVSPSPSTVQPYKPAFGPGGSGLPTNDAASPVSAPAASISTTPSATSFLAATNRPSFFSVAAHFQQGTDAGTGGLRHVNVDIPAHLIPPPDSQRKFVLGGMTKEEYEGRIRKAEEARQHRRDAGLDSDEEEETEPYYGDEDYDDEDQDDYGHDNDGLSEVPEEEYDVIDN